MNYKILTKILEELNKPTPDISYMRGMIETLISFENRADVPVMINNMVNKAAKAINAFDTDIGRTPDLNSIKDFIDKSVKIDG